MRKSILKKVTVAVLSVAMLVTSVLPGTALAKEQSGEGDAIASQNRAALNLSVAGVLRQQGATPTPSVVTDANKEALLYGSRAGVEYALGTAGHFALFGEEVIFDNVWSDFEGRAAAKALTVVGGHTHGVIAQGKYVTGDNGGDTSPKAAAIVCDNRGMVFEGIKPDDITMVVSDEVSRIEFRGYDQANYNKNIKNVYTTPVNGVINFDKEMAYLRSLSAKLGGFASNGTVEVTPGYEKYILTGSNNKLNIFSITASQIANAKGFDINIPQGSYCVINVSGASVDYSGFIAEGSNILHGTRSEGQISQDSENNCLVLFNFYEATEVRIHNSTRGSLLAPNATITKVADDMWPIASGHNAGQIIGKKVQICNETGALGFTMPASYLTNYTPHYLYYTADGKLKEMPADMYQLLIGQDAAPMPKEGVAYDAGYDEDEQIATNVTSEAFFEAMGEDSSFAIYKTLHELGIDPKFEVYTDGKDWFDALEGSGLENASEYKNMTRHSDIALDNLAYTFGKSNVYFIMYPLARVAVDVMWDDKQNQDAKRPGSYEVTLTERFSDNTSETREELNTLTGDATQVTKTDSELNKDVTFDYYEGTYTTLVPLFGNQQKGNGSYGAGQQYFAGDNAVFGISYSAPKGYRDITKADGKVSFPADGALFDENGVAATYHIVLALEYKATFYFVGADGEKTEVFKNNYKNYRGLGTFTNIPDLSQDDKMELLGENYLNSNYTVVWRDIETGQTYNPDSTYAFNYRDVIFEATVRRTETIDNSPWLYSNIIYFRNSHYIPAPNLVERLKADKTTENDYWGFNYIQHNGSDYSTAVLGSGKYDDEKFLMISFVCGIDKGRADFTRITVSTKGYAAKDPVLYEAEKASVTDVNKGFTDAFSAMPGVNPNGKSIQTLLSRDPYKNDYDGMRIIRLVFPAEAYKNETLYFTVYYEKDGTEYVWAYYPVCIKSNEYWTLK